MYHVTPEIVAEELQKFSVGDDFRSEIQVHMLDFGEENKSAGKESEHLLDKFGVNLTRLAREGKIDPVVGPRTARSSCVGADPCAPQEQTTRS